MHFRSDFLPETGIRDLTVNASSLFDVHAPMLEHIENGVVTGVRTRWGAEYSAKAATETWLREERVNL